MALIKGSNGYVQVALVRMEELINQFLRYQLMRITLSLTLKNDQSEVLPLRQRTKYLKEPSLGGC